MHKKFDINEEWLHDQLGRNSPCHFCGMTLDSVIRLESCLYHTYHLYENADDWPFQIDINDELTPDQVALLEEYAGKINKRFSECFYASCNDETLNFTQDNIIICCPWCGKDKTHKEKLPQLLEIYNIVSCTPLEEYQIDYIDSEQQELWYRLVTLLKQVSRITKTDNSTYIYLEDGYLHSFGEKIVYNTIVDNGLWDPINNKVNEDTLNRHYILQKRLFGKNFLTTVYDRIIRYKASSPNYDVNDNYIKK